MDRFVVSLFDNFATAMNAVSELEDNGFNRDDISVVAQEEVLRRSPRLESIDLNTVLGRPRVTQFRAIGPVMGTGYIFSYIVEQPARSSSYSLVEMLTTGGVPMEDAHIYAEAVRRGAVLVAVRDTGGNAERAADILDSHESLVMDDYVNEWRREGWSRFDENGEPLDHSQLNWPQNITALPGDPSMEDVEERNWPSDITGSYAPTSESPEEESWPKTISERENKEEYEDQEINWPQNLVDRPDDDRR